MMKILDLIKKAKETIGHALHKSETASEAEAQHARDPKNPFLRRKIPPLLGWYKKDNAFVRKEMGLMKPPDEDAAYFKAKGWIKKKLKDPGSKKNSEPTPIVEKPVEPKTRDQDINNFLSDLLKPDANPHTLKNAKKTKKPE